MEEKRLECLIMLQIRQSDTSIDNNNNNNNTVGALMQLLTDLPPLQHGGLTF